MEFKKALFITILIVGFLMNVNAGKNNLNEGLKKLG